MHGCILITDHFPDDSWQRDLIERGVRTVRPDALGDPAAVAGADCVLIDGGIADPVGAARRIYEIDPPVQVCILVTPAQRQPLERSILFTPGLGEVWIDEAGSADGGLLTRAADVTAQRRSYRTLTQQVEHELAAIEPQMSRRIVISDAYLAALLVVLPDPVISIADDRILSWNPAAERVLGVRRRNALNSDVAAVLGADAARELERLFAAATSDRPARGEITIEADADNRTLEVVVAPVAAAGRQVHVVLMHDVTERRLVQRELESTAYELHAQASELQHQSAQLQETQAELEQANEELQRANAVLAERTAEAERARAEAEAANRAKSDFLATMSHEIRTPINAIVGYTDLLELQLAGPLTDAQGAYLERVRQSSRHLLTLIEDILDLAKVEARRVEVARERLPVVNVIAAAIALVAPQAEDRGIALETPTLEQGEALYVGDEQRVRQILVNLLTNAIKFTEPGGTVTVSYGVRDNGTPAGASAHGPWTWICVRDTGIGIAAEDVERVFRPFEQVEQGHTRTRGGSGLGLAISRQLARLMGGDVTVASAAGAGSTFTLWLPQEEPAQTPGPLDALAITHLPVGLTDIGRRILRELPRIVSAYLRRIRTEPIFSAAPQLDDTTIVDHAGTYVADVAQCLIALGTSRAAGELLRDGSEIQRLIARLHAEQRLIAGWSAEALAREFRILADEIRAAVRAHPADAPDVEPGLHLASRLLEHGQAVSLEHFSTLQAGGSG